VCLSGFSLFRPIVLGTERTYSSSLSHISGNNHIHPMAGQIKSRDHFGMALSMLLPNATSMVEVGVQRASFAETILNTWDQNKKYILVDQWATEARERYLDAANVVNQTLVYAEAVRRMERLQVEA
jgi:hypothetical protein